MQIVGPKTKLKHLKRISGDETPDGQEIIWSSPIRFEGVMTLLTGSEVIMYQQMQVFVKYKVLTNYLKIAEEDKVTRNSLEYDVKLVDDKFLMNKISVVLLSAEKE